MRISRRTVLVVACLLAAVTVVVTLGSLVSVDAPAFKGRFESAASDPLGLRVTVDGRFAVGFNGRLRLVMSDVHVRNSRGAEVLTAERATISVAVLPILFNQSRVHRIELVRPRIAVERGRDGILNWSRRAKQRGMIPVLARARLSLREGTVRYEDERSGTVYTASGIDAEVRGIRTGAPRVPSLLGGLLFHARISCEAIQGKSLGIGDVRVVADAENGVVNLDPVTMRIFGGEGLVSLRAELPDSIPRYRLRGSLSGFQIAQCLRPVSTDSILSGVMSFAANVSSSGRSPDEWTRNLEGEISLRGRQITLHGLDLDHEVGRMEANQNLDLAGIGSVFFVGPLGIAAAKGLDFVRLTKQSGENTHIDALVSSWDAKGGELRAEDVALATSKNRIALQGGLDFVQQRFDSVTVALIDKEGCAKMRQELRGTFQKPDLTKPTVPTVLLGPARTVYETVKALLPGGPCTVFYAGSVRAPE